MSTIVAKDWRVREHSERSEVCVSTDREQTGTIVEVEVEVGSKTKTFIIVKFFNLNIYYNNNINTCINNSLAT